MFFKKKKEAVKEEPSGYLEKCLKRIKNSTISCDQGYVTSCGLSARINRGYYICFDGAQVPLTESEKEMVYIAMRDKNHRAATEERKQKLARL